MFGKSRDQWFGTFSVKLRIILHNDKLNKWKTRQTTRIDPPSHILTAVFGSSPVECDRPAASTPYFRLIRKARLRASGLTSTVSSGSAAQSRCSTTAPRTLAVRRSGRDLTRSCTTTTNRSTISPRRRRFTRTLRRSRQRPCLWSSLATRAM